ncbi:MAG TPA: LysE family translocator [Buttiauxella sp.]|nr:LysE family translocator [Buttiauxella sp.]
MNVMLSMMIFALVSSVSPGPVNLVALSSGVSFGWRACVPHVTGATIGFTLLLLATGYGLYEVLNAWPVLLQIVNFGGVAFLLWMAWRLARDNGEFSRHQQSRAPSAFNGALMQWLNPKAWLACVAGMGLYASDGNPATIWLFSGIYFVVCYLSIMSWALAGASLSNHLHQPSRIRLLNRTLAALLVACAVWLIFD